MLMLEDPPVLDVMMYWWRDQGVVMMTSLQTQMMRRMMYVLGMVMYEYRWRGLVVEAVLYVVQLEMNRSAPTMVM